MKEERWSCRSPLGRPLLLDENGQEAKREDLVGQQEETRKINRERVEESKQRERETRKNNKKITKMKEGRCVSQSLLWFHLLRDEAITKRSKDRPLISKKRY